MTIENLKKGVELVWVVTGTFHGSIIGAKTEGEARRIFHKYYNGESIISVKKTNTPAWCF